MEKNTGLASRSESPAARGNAAKRQAILGAAADAVCRHGLSGACIDDIADRARVSRQTIYNQYGDRNALFSAVVEEVMARVNASIFGLLATFPEDGADLEDGLARFLVSLSRSCIVNKDGRFLRKLVQSEGANHPELYESWRRHGPLKMTSALGACLARLSTKGILAIDDFDLAARQLLALGQADIQMQILLGETPSDSELESAARNAAKTFLRAFAPAASSRTSDETRPRASA
jgi:AcrR family transcriptional regulator